MMPHTPSHTRNQEAFRGKQKLDEGLTGSTPPPPEVLTVRSEISSTLGRKTASFAPPDASESLLSQGESCTPPEKKASRPEKATPKVNPSPRCTVASAHGSYTPLVSPP
uniref:Uncharacterized protein n=1 Tax=Oryza brachyantha TaxID=4533 RepID=J3LTI6_ORYBR